MKNKKSVKIRVNLWLNLMLTIIRKQLMTKIDKNDWRPVATTGALLTTTDVSLATTDILWTTIGDHRRPLATICRLLSNVQVQGH